MKFQLFAAVSIFAAMSVPYYTEARDDSYRIMRVEPKSSKSVGVSKSGKSKSGKAMAPAATTRSPSRHPVTSRPSAENPSPSLNPVSSYESEKPSLSPSLSFSPTYSPTYTTGSELDPIMIYNKYADKMLTIKDGVCLEGNTIETGAANGSYYQQFLYNNETGSVESVGCPGMALDLIAGNDSVCDNGLLLVIARKEPSGKKSQAFTYNNGIIENLLCPGFVVDIHGFGTSEGVKIYLWTFEWDSPSQWNQLWEIIPAPTSPSRRILRSSKSSKQTSSFLDSSMTNDADCASNECINPAGECDGVVQCFTDPCEAAECGHNEKCEPNFCGGCNAVCLPENGIFH